jgi:molybdopterin/thiamine biosynthesis adenylyltransferase
MSNISYGRQTDILDPAVASACHVTICGLGTIGSHAAVELARLGVGSLHLIDGDVVDDVNIPSQAYEVADIGRPKADACAERVRAVSDHVRVRTEQAMLSGGEFFEAGPVVLAVDNMDARKAILEGSVAYQPDKTLVIDGRMGGKTLQLLAFDPSPPEGVDLAKWNSDFFFAQEDAFEIPCGGRTVSFVGAYVGALIASYVCRHLVGKPVPAYLQTDLDSFYVMHRKTL